MSHDCALVVLNNHGGMSQFAQSGADQSKMKYVWDCFSGSFWVKKRVFHIKQNDCMKFLKYNKGVGFSELGLPSIVIDDSSTIDKGKLRYFEKKATHTLPDWIKEHGPSMELSYILGLLDALRKIHQTKYRPQVFLNMVTSEFSFYDREMNLFHGDISPRNILL